MFARPVVLALVLASCGACRASKPAPTSDASTATTASSRATVATGTAAPVPTREPETPPLASDAGLAGCATLEGPVKLARPGPYAIASRLGFVDLYTNDHGKPALAGSVRVDPKPGAPTRGAPAPEPATTRGSRPPCAAAGSFVFCASSAGEIRRYRLGAAAPEADNFVARGRAGGPVAAATISGHPVVAYTRDATTSEGVVSEAFVESDDGTELRLSEDGAGATTLAIVPHGANALAVYVDARRGMSPVHARTISLAPKLALGKDAVLFIAGGAEPGTRVAAGASGAAAYALLPVAHDLAFGLATVKIDGEPRTDAPVLWSDYPNGLDPAPVAATTDASRAFVARVRPSAPKFGSPRVLEIGTLDGSGAFAPLGVVATEGAPANVAIEGDGAGFVLAWTSGGTGWAARYSCPAKP